MLEFCPVCKGILFVRKEGEKNIGYCSCGFKRTAGIELSASEINKSRINGLGIVQADDSKGFTHKCPKCGNDSSELMDLGEILNSEKSVCLYKCKNCGYVDRES